MNLFYYDHHEFSLPEKHRFPAVKYRLLRERVQSSGNFSYSNLIPAPAATFEQLRQGHTADYLNRLQHGQLTRDEIRRIGLPWSPQLVKRVQHTVGATIAATKAARARTRRGGIARKRLTARVARSGMTHAAMTA